jgi:hypothetical protein
MASLRDFSVRMNALAAKVEGGGTRIQRQVAIAIVQPLVMATPVGNVVLWNAESRHSAPQGYVGGRARGNWHVSVGGSDSRVIEAPDSGGAGTISAANSAIEASTPREPIYINNNLPYIVPLNQGHSKQAPVAFVETAVQHGLERLRELRILD